MYVEGHGGCNYDIAHSATGIPDPGYYQCLPDQEFGEKGDLGTNYT